MDEQSNFKDSNYEPFEEEEEGDFEGFVEVQNNTTKESESSSIKKSKKQTSEAWDYFDLITINGIQKALCKFCKSKLSYSRSSGTSHLLKHAKNSCSGKYLKLAAGQSQLKIKTEVDGTTSLTVKEKLKSKIKCYLIKMFQGKSWLRW